MVIYDGFLSWLYEVIPSTVPGTRVGKCHRTKSKTLRTSPSARGKLLRVVYVSDSYTSLKHSSVGYRRGIVLMKLLIATLLSMFIHCDHVTVTYLWLPTHITSRWTLERIINRHYCRILSKYGSLGPCVLSGRHHPDARENIGHCFRGIFKVRRPNNWPNKFRQWLSTMNMLNVNGMIGSRGSSHQAWTSRVWDNRLTVLGYSRTVNCNL